MNPIVLAGYALLSAITFAVYAVDKHAARRGAHRISERALHLWAWAGGFLGALAAQQLLRHKSRRPGMILGAGLAGAAHVAGWWWYLSGAGASG